MNPTTTSSLTQFDVEGDIRSVGIRWEKWKRAFLIYIEATGIEDSLKKRANLLHHGGFGLQEIFYNIPGANLTDQENEAKAFEIAIRKLDEYFSLKHSKVYERHVFRLMKQEEEGFGKFLLRLRNQAGKCKFGNVEENLIDQIVEKGSSTELRKKILAAGDAITLEKVIITGDSKSGIGRIWRNLSKFFRPQEPGEFFNV
ncbi:uncharacterized protein [Leptinotarsa decemlineata]|uniref:uncharacterized protein n=1 Tax=Leptinotarsa decemlineata TaxID=7539 RepID=UPI003D304A5A